MLANRLCQATDFNLTHRVRQDPGAYRDLRFGADPGQFRFNRNTTYPAQGGFAGYRGLTSEFAVRRLTPSRLKPVPR